MPADLLAESAAVEAGLLRVEVGQLRRQRDELQVAVREQERRIDQLLEAVYQRWPTDGIALTGRRGLVGGVLPGRPAAGHRQ